MILLRGMVRLHGTVSSSLAGAAWLNLVGESTEEAWSRVLTRLLSMRRIAPQVAVRVRAPHPWLRGLWQSWRMGTLGEQYAQSVQLSRADKESLKLLQEKHPPSYPDFSFPSLDMQYPPPTMSTTEIIHVFFSPMGSSGGPDGLRP